MCSCIIRRWWLSLAGVLYCIRSEVAHKPKAQAKDSPSLALQACVSILPALSIVLCT